MLAVVSTPNGETPPATPRPPDAYGNAYSRTVWSREAARCCLEKHRAKSSMTPTVKVQMSTGARMLSSSHAPWPYLAAGGPIIADVVTDM